MQVLDALFRPRSIAVAGAGSNPASMGARNLALIQRFGFSGRLYAINPQGEPCGAVPGFRRVTDVPGPVDLCLIAVPARQAPGVVADCAAHRVPVAQVFSSGFGAEGAGDGPTEGGLLAAAGGVTRLVGPNCLGTHVPAARLTFVSDPDPTPGRIAIATQSGGMGVDLVVQARARGLGLRALVSMGNCADLSPIDFLRHFARDPETGAIGFYLEGLRDGPAFLGALRETVRAGKPVVVLKGGRTDAGAGAAASHTGALAGRHAVWRAALRQAGAIEACSVDELLAILAALEPGVPAPGGSGVALLGNGGGATVLAADALADAGFHVAPLGESTRAALAAVPMPPGSTVGNPTDVPAGALDRAGAQGLGEVIRALLADRGVGALIAHFNLLPFLNYDDPGRFVAGIGAALATAAGRRVPVLVALRSAPLPEAEALRQAALRACRAAGLPCFHDAAEAIAALAAARRFHGGAVAGRSGERAAAAVVTPAPAEAARLVARAKAAGLASLPQDQALALLDRFGIPHPPARLARSAEEAAAAAAAVGFPVALKVDSPDILHKTEAGGVRLGLATAGEVVDAFESVCAAAERYRPGARVTGALVSAMAPPGGVEVICGVRRDPVCGPTLLLGLGGVLVELLADTVLRVLPAPPAEIRSMWRELAGARLLTGYRGAAPADTDALEDLLLRLCALASALPDVTELDLNPVVVLPKGRGVLALDVRMLL